MSEESSPPQPSQAQDVQIGRDFQVMGAGHHVDFSQTHIGTQIIQVSVEEIQQRPLIPVSPYKGLRKFEVTDAQRFFGREQLVESLIQQLEQQDFLLLLGASGSGKSSVIRAGLIPALAERWGTWVELTFTPDENPFDAFYASLLGSFKQSQAKPARQVSPETLIQTIQALQQPETPWLIFVDQFEELFTSSQPSDRDAFIAGLVHLHQSVTQLAGRVKVVMAMRADFLDRFSPYPGLGTLAEKSMRLIPDMTPEELQRAIAQPAAQHGVAFETGLIQEILSDLQGQPGELPLLEYTLDLLWQRATLSDRLICCTTYWEIGSVQGALQRHVDQIYRQLSPTEQTLTKQIFLRLVNVTGSTEANTASGKTVSRRAYLSEFSDPAVQSVLKKLIDANLLVSNQQPVPVQTAQNSAIAPVATVEVAHETLLHSWPTLKQWLEESKEVLSINHRLCEDARRWQKLQDTEPAIASDELWRGSKLERARELEQDGTFAATFGQLGPTEQDFLQESLALRARQQQEQEARRQRELRQYRNTAIGALTSLGIMLLLGGGALWNWRIAERGQIEALMASANASFVNNSRSLDTLMAALQAGDRVQHSLWFGNNERLRAEALNVVSQAVYSVREQNRLEGHTDGVLAVSVSPADNPEDQILATAGLDRTVRLWDHQGQLLKTWEGHDEPISSVKFSPDGQIIATASYDQTIKLWNREGKLLHTLSSDHGRVWSVSFSPNTNSPLLVAAHNDGNLTLWNLQGTLIKSIPAHDDEVYSVSFSPDGQTIASGGINQTVKLWNLQGQPIRPPFRQNDQVLSLQFSPDGQTLAIATNDGTAQILNIASGNTELKIEGHEAGVTDIAFSPDGQQIATSSTDNLIKVWTLDGQELYTLKGHNGSVRSLAFNRDGSLLATASLDKTVKLWQLKTPQQRVLARHQGAVYGVRFSPNGQILATGGADNTVILWNTDGTFIRALEAEDIVNGVSISPDNQKVAAALDQGAVKIWSVDGTLINTIKAHDQDVMSVSFSPDGTAIATASRDGTAKLWNRDGSLRKILQKDTDAVYSVNFSADGSLLAAASGDGTVNLWNRDGNLIETLPHNVATYQAIFSSDNQILATASEDNTVRLWSRDGQLLHKLTGHEAGIWGLSFSADGQYLASGSDDKTVKIWTLDGKLIANLTGHHEPVNSVSFNPKLPALATGSADSLVILWHAENLDLKSLMQIGCKWLITPLNQKLEKGFHSGDISTCNSYNK